MDLRTQADLRIIRTDAPRKPRKNHTALFAALTLSAGALCGVAAVLGIGPFGAIHASASYAHSTQPTPQPIEARSVFPAVSPVTKVVNVNDPPRQQPHSEAAPKPRPTRPPDDHPTPSPGGEPGDE